MEPNTLVNGWVPKDMGTEFRSGLITQSTRENGRMIRLMVEENYTMLMEMFMMGNGRTTKLMEEASILMLMELFMTVSGSMTNNTVMELNLGPMELDTREITLTERKKEKELSISLMDRFSKETSKVTKSMVLEYTSGPTVKSMKVNG